MPFVAPKPQPIPMEILDEGLGKQRSAEEESEFQLLKMDAESAGKNIRNGTIALYVLAILQLVISAFIFMSDGSTMFGDATESNNMGVGLIIFAVGYGTLGFFSKKYAVVCFSITLVLYIITNLFDAIDNPASLGKGLLLKIALVYVWAKALQGGLAMKSLIQRASYLGASEEELRA